MDLITNYKDLISYFSRLGKSTATPMQKRAFDKGVYVRSKIRVDVLTSEEQGRVIINGTPKRFKFTNKGSGVWLVTIVDLSDL